MTSLSAGTPKLFPDIPSLDPERIAMLRELCLDAGDDVLQEIISSWETEARRHMAAAEEAMIASDGAKAKAAAHALKGSCGNMGAARLAELSRQLEAKVAAPAEARAILLEMQTEFARTREQLVKLGR